MIIRSILFHIGLVLVTIVYGIIAPIISPLVSINTRYRMGAWWCSIILKWLSFSCNVEIKIIGRENIPKNGHPAIIMANHQSSPETFLCQSIFHPAVPILKREIFKIPFFGWAAWAAKPIGIDRDKPRQALQQMMSMGQARLSGGTNVFIFPEGTRTNYPEVGKFARGGAQLAQAAKVSVIPVAHNAGAIWPTNTKLKKSGSLTFIIGKPIPYDPDVSSALLTKKVREWIIDQNL